MSTNIFNYPNGFNSGYLMAKYEPSLITGLAKNLTPSNEFVTGILEGKQQYEAEHMLSHLKALRDRGRDREEPIR